MAELRSRRLEAVNELLQNASRLRDYASSHSSIGSHLNKDEVRASVARICAELCVMTIPSDRQVDELIQQCDRNGDGELSHAEFVALIKRLLRGAKSTLQAEAAKLQHLATAAAGSSIATPRTLPRARLQRGSMTERGGGRGGRASNILFGERPASAPPAAERAQRELALLRRAVQGQIGEWDGVASAAMNGIGGRVEVLISEGGLELEARKELRQAMVSYERMLRRQKENESLCVKCGQRLGMSEHLAVGLGNAWLGRGVSKAEGWCGACRRERHIEIYGPWGVTAVVAERGS